MINKCYLTMTESDQCTNEIDTLSREEWLSEHECDISDLWNAMRSYLEYKNSYLFDNCDYVLFSDIVAYCSSHYA